MASAPSWWGRARSTLARLAPTLRLLDALARGLPCKLATGYKPALCPFAARVNWRRWERELNSQGHAGQRFSSTAAGRFGDPSMKWLSPQSLGACPGRRRSRASWLARLLAVRPAGENPRLSGVNRVLITKFLCTIFKMAEVWGRSFKTPSPSLGIPAPPGVLTPTFPTTNGDFQGFLPLPLLSMVMALLSMVST